MRLDRSASPTNPHETLAGRGFGATLPADGGRRATAGRIAALATQQYGVITRAQLAACGLSEAGIDRRVAQGHLIRLHRGVYALGHAVLIPDGRRLAAVLASGARGVRADTDALATHGLGRAGGTHFRVIVPPGGRRPGRRPGLIVVQRDLRPEETTVVRRIPVTAIWRTVVDVAARGRERQVAKAIDAVIATDR